MGARSEGASLEVRQQRRVLFGLLRDPVDGGPSPRFHLRQQLARRSATGGRGVDRVAMGTRLGVAEHLVQPRFDPRRDRALQVGGLLVRLRPAEADHRREQPFEQGVASEDPVGCRTSGVG